MQKFSHWSVWSFLFMAAVALGVVFTPAALAQNDDATNKATDSASDDKESTGANAGAPSDTKGQKGGDKGVDKNKDAAAGAPSTKKDSKAVDKVGDGDAAVLGHIVVLNENEINAASVAQQKKLSEKGKQLADMIQQDHTKNLDETRQLAEDIGVKPVEDQHAKEMRANAEKELAAIKDKDGEEFEAGFIAMMVKGHQHGVDMIDNICKPMAENKKLQAHLARTRQTVSQHLQHCERAQGDHGDHGDAGENAEQGAQSKKQGRNNQDSNNQGGAAGNAPTGANEAARGGEGGGQAPGANVREDAQSQNNNQAGDEAR